MSSGSWYFQKQEEGTAESTLVKVKVKVKNPYTDVDDYIATYEPLIFEEAKSQIIKEKEEEEGWSIIKSLCPDTGTGKTQTILGILSTILHATPTRVHSKTYKLRQGPQLPTEEKSIAEYPSKLIKLILTSIVSLACWLALLPFFVEFKNNLVWLDDVQ
ncbi:uncharacterized protein LOC106757388 isoform X2 [Vigna radiata var. radiata]|uniref:Uncharacterized protein LOC106757388 isoform X2 n=1 Tax=Vigna radiata var. radiata TaxID=3916 RepID=A0A3Q0ET87_VIGRR|nr:uncharacterized protein LOC106757388 isoform X2 [Vigna radiata var. radiata]